jgi:hypothetical protein
MLDKLKVIAAFSVVLQLVRVFFPALDFGAEFEGAAKALIEALYVLIPVAAGWFTKESEALVHGLKLR